MTAANFRTLAMAVIAFSAAALSAGCNLEPSAPGNPTYEADVRPIFMSRCVRCHGVPGLGDPMSLSGAAPPSSPRFDVYADTNCDPDAGSTAACIRGAAFAAKATLFEPVLLHLDQKSGGMPPYPAPALTSYQRDTILKWEAEAANGGTPLE
jgi:hypothetical protein